MRVKMIMCLSNVIFIFTFPLLFSSACIVINGAQKETPKEMHHNFSPAWPHGEITQIFENVFMVTGTNIIHHDGERIQSSRNMVIVREDRALTLINTVRLSEDGLKALEYLGQVTNIIRIGAFHGRDDAFYQHRYHAKLWAFSTMEFSHGERLDFDLKEGRLLIANSELFTFRTTAFPEAVILLNIEGGILISCDSIKNWTKRDEYFDEETFELMKRLGSIGEAKIDATWLQAMNPSKDEIEKILKLKFKNLLSAHGEPLKNEAKLAVQHTIQSILPTLKK